MTPARGLVVGVGHPDRGDDAVGLLVARAAALRAPPNVDVVSAPAGLLVVLEELHGRDAVVIVDAVRSGRPPGTLRRVDLARPLPHDPAGSTHGFGIGAAVELARTLDWLPPVAILVGVEAGIVDVGADLDPRVRAVLPTVVDLALELAGEHRHVPG